MRQTWSIDTLGYLQLNPCRLAHPWSRQQQGWIPKAGKVVGAPLGNRVMSTFLAHGPRLWVCCSSACPSHSQGRAKAPCGCTGCICYVWWTGGSWFQKNRSCSEAKHCFLSQFSAHKQVTQIPPQHASLWEPGRLISERLMMPLTSGWTCLTMSSSWPWPFIFFWNWGRFLALPVLAENNLEMSNSTTVGLCSSFPNAADTVIHFLSGEI